MTARNPRPLWRCPKCGKYYVTRNIWHACARHTVAEHFVRKDPELRLLFDGVVGFLKRCGRLRIVPGKTGIAFQVRMRFAGVIVRKSFLDVGFLLPRRLEHQRIRKCIAYSPRAFDHHVEIRSPEDLDDGLAAWLREAYRVGQQLDILARKKLPPREGGRFSWSEPLHSAPAREKSIPRWASTPSRGSPLNHRQELWTCAKCGRAFVYRNQLHICSNLTLKAALKEKSPSAIALFRKLGAMARRCGPVRIFPQKTRFAFQARTTFLGVRFLRNSIECEFVLPRRIEHPRFRLILSPGLRTHYHYLRISSLDELDRTVLGWLREASRSGGRPAKHREA